jgi:hypothetical protein
MLNRRETLTSLLATTIGAIGAAWASTSSAISTVPSRTKLPNFG